MFQFSRRQRYNIFTSIITFLRHNSKVCNSLLTNMLDSHLYSSDSSSCLDKLVYFNKGAVKRAPLKWAPFIRAPLTRKAHKNRFFIINPLSAKSIWVKVKLRVKVKFWSKSNFESRSNFGSRSNF